ncbi:LacI family transcriptional regulator [Flagellimonas sp. HMM57]|uniref:LacI family DNA-binding transcriptional regulator n=1 Tax=unclassified Flagellimonas TaxID=2644544 RepID=UPI0013D67007|nr:MULTISPECIES: LacI family DNA-binding transcriptional regulator [unclassified Flagellimonas]UII74621.1 LacI family transcriptional regulator [Flagellimonas sp. HMM57]
MAGIKEIAKRTGLSLATVSRVFNNSALVSPTTRQKVLKAAKDLDYQPNITAAALRSGKSKIIGVIVPEVNNYFFSGIINGIEGIVSESDYNIIIAQSHELQEKEDEALNSFLKLNVEGILLSISKQTTDFSSIKKILKSKTPIVFFDRIPNLDSVNSVTLNDYMGAFIATEHLLTSNCKNLLHVAGNPKVSIFKDRQRGFSNAILKSGRKDITSHIVELTGDVEKDMKILKKLFKVNPNMDGIFAYGDEIGLHVLNLLKDLNVNVPEKIKLIGFGNANFSNLTQPKISTVDQECSQMGELAAELLLQNLNNKNARPETKVLSPKLVKRASTQV